jgi:hypothetical protein
MSARAAGQSCSFFLARLQGEIARLRQVVFPGHETGPRKWLNFISGLLDTASDYLQKAADPATQAPDASKLIKDAEVLGGIAYKFLTHVAGADATQIPHQVVAPFKRWVDTLKIGNTIFFRAEHLPNYELAWFDARLWLSSLNNPSATLTDAVTKIDWPVLRVTVPGQAMGMLPHFAVVAHELGHAIQDSIKPDFAPHQAALDDCIMRITGRLTAKGVNFGMNERIRFTRIADSWINELKADAVGHCLVGPAFFFALCGFLELAGQFYGISPTHPPSDLRRALLVSELSAGGLSFIEVFRQKTTLTIDATVNSPHVPTCPPADPLFAELEPQYGLLDAAICVELVPYISVVAPTIFQKARAHLSAVCPDLIYTPAQLGNDLDEHLDSLCRLVPPIEYRNAKGVFPAALSSILNVGWAALLTRLDEVPENPEPPGDKNARKMERLHALLLKAVELSEARRLWEEHK